MSGNILTKICVVLGIAVLAGSGYLWLSGRTGKSNQIAGDSHFADFLPGPLQSDTSDAGGLLTVKGTISETNQQRAQNGQSELVENTLLNRAAAAKVADMFAKNYFAHDSPEGRGPSDLAKDAGYEFIIIGENLALGGFDDDADLVQAWMDSPGHRENILKKSYTEIGVAVAQGMYDGKLTWLAVQEFGRPSSDCKPVNFSLGTLLDANKNEMKDLEKRLEVKQAEVARTPNNTAAYNQRANEYNSLVEEYNDLSTRSKKMATEYNSDVDRYNACLRNSVK